MLVPNILYAFSNRDMQNLCTHKGLLLTEQAGRYGCMILMWLPLLAWTSEFSGSAGKFLCLPGSGAMLLAYLVIWRFYRKRFGKGTVTALAAAENGVPYARDVNASYEDGRFRTAICGMDR